MKTAFIASIHTDYLPLIKIASNDDIAAFIKGQIKYAETGEIPCLNGISKALFEMHIALIKRLEETKEKKSNAGSSGAKARYGKLEPNNAEPVPKQCHSSAIAEPNNAEPVPKPNTVTVTDTVTDTDSVVATATTPQPPASRGAAVAAENQQGTREAVPFVKIMEQYNFICTRLRGIESIEGNRKKAVSARFKTYGYDKIILVFEKANKSDFLCGGGSKNWTADFDWLMSATNTQKVLEDKYINENKQPIPQGQSPPQDNRTPANSNPFLKIAKEKVDAFHNENQ